MLILSKEQLAQKDEALTTKDSVLETFIKQVERSESLRSEVEFQLGTKNLEYMKIMGFKDNMIFLTSNACRKFVGKKNDHQIVPALKKMKIEHPDFLDEIVKMFEEQKCSLRKYLDQVKV